MNVWLDTPLALLLVLPIAALLVMDGLRPWRAGRSTVVLASAVRGLMFLLLTLALASPVVRGVGGPATVVFVVDCSDSIAEAQRQAALRQLASLRKTLPLGARSGLVMASGEARVDGLPDQPWQVPNEVSCAGGDRTDLGAGVELALGLIDPASAGRVVLLTDGADTADGLREASASARSLGIPVDLVLLRPRERDPRVRRLELDQPVVRPGQTVSGSVLVHSGVADGPAEVIFRLGGEVIAEQQLTLRAGQDHRALFEHALGEAVADGAHVVEVELRPPGDDADLHNNRSIIELVVGPPPRVLAIANNSEELEGMARVLAGESMVVDRHTTAHLGQLDLNDYDLIIIGDVPAAPELGGLSVPFMEMTRRWVSAGGGLITLGGDRTYDLGGWGATPLAPVLPLELHADGRKVQPSVAMVKVMDNSASMGDWSGRHTKMALANEAAAAASTLLRPRDYLAVIAVNDEVHWVRKLSAMRDPVQATAAIRSIRPSGGGIYTYTALEAARTAFLGVDTPLKHVILYADAQDAEEKVKGHPMAWGAGPSAYQLATGMRAKGITLSVIALGDPRDQDVGFLRELARIGGGRFHITKQPEQLKALFVQETQQLITSIVHDDPFKVSIDAAHPSLDGVEVGIAPPLGGYVEVDARDLATVSLRGPNGRPILVSWRYGLGQVASLSTDLGPRWGRRWLPWRGYSRFVVQLSRWALRPPEARSTAVEVESGDLGSRVRIVRRTFDGLSLAERGLEGVLIGEDGQHVVPLHAERPGLWTADIETVEGRTYELLLREADGTEVLSHAFIAPSTREHEPPEHQAVLALAAGTGGQVGPTTIGALPDGHGRPRGMWWVPALLAVLLLPVDAWLRRAARVI